MKKFSIFIVIYFLLVLTGLSKEPLTDPLNGMLIINEDNSHFFGSRPPEEMTIEGLNAFVDQYSGTKITHLFLCPNAMRANFRSSVRDAIWDPVGGKEPVGRWPQNAKLLHDRGLDPYRIWIDRAREKGISPWISVRMNDLHSVNEDGNFMHSSFWRNHPEFRRVPQSGGRNWGDRALNFRYKEVREYTLNFIKELFERYNFDGIELDWMRFGYHLTPGNEKNEALYLTGFMRDVNDLRKIWSQKRGHEILLAARVPATPEAALGLGMDAVAWGKEGLIDLLIPCPFWTTSDFDIPIEVWKEALNNANAKTALAPGLEFNIRPFAAAKPVRCDLPALYGFVDAERARGANNIYLFNWMDSGTRPVNKNEYQTLLEEGVSQEKIASSLRRIPLTFHDTVPNEMSKGEQLPKDLKNGAEFRIPGGTAIQQGKVSVLIGLRGNKETALEIRLNGKKMISGSSFSSLEQISGNPQSAYLAFFPSESMKQGSNTVTVAPGSGIAVWLELRIEP